MVFTFVTICYLSKWNVHLGTSFTKYQFFKIQNKETYLHTKVTIQSPIKGIYS